MKKYVCISGFNVKQANRGNAALSYGAVSFLLVKGLLHEGQELVLFSPWKNIFRKKNYKIKKETFKVQGKEWVLHTVPISFIEILLMKLGISLPFTKAWSYIVQTEFEAADYGGDGMTDIYGDALFIRRFRQTRILWQKKVPLIMLPMTIGPFIKTQNKLLAEKVIRYASKVYVRDNNYVSELERMGITYEREKDLSAYMQPEPWDVHIEKNAVGINVSGLAYSNHFGNLAGQFGTYPNLINALIRHFTAKGMHVYLIPHSYRYGNPEKDNDDMVACKAIYRNIDDKTYVHFVDKDLTSPQVKFVISQMKFFIGTRMHANFAAIYTHVPVFGLAYSYKFKGAFDANGLNGELQTHMINGMKEEDIPLLVQKIDQVYKRLTIYEN